MPVGTVVAFRRTIIQKASVTLTIAAADRAMSGYALAQDAGRM